jgi:ABC-type transport system involved in cytochrome bd biosynthesis fused ATPase/permease subunit
MPMNATLVIMPFQDVAGQASQQASVAREQLQAMRDQAQAQQAQQAMRDAAQGVRDAARAHRGFPMYMPGERVASHRQEAMFFIMLLVCAMAAVAILRPLFQGIGRRLDRAGRPDELAASGAAARLERIEQAVEAMAVEIERISEGQRFTTKLLTTREPARLPGER